MDPNVTLAFLLEALLEKQANRLEQTAEHLATWIRAGGFLPRATEAVTRVSLLYGNDSFLDEVLALCRKYE